MASASPPQHVPALRDINVSKVASIMNYLDEVDRASSVERPKSPGEDSRMSAPLGSVLRRSYPVSEAGGVSVLSLAGRENVFHGIKSKIEALRVENAELKQQSDRLRSRLAESDDEHARDLRRLRDAARDEADSQRSSMQQSIDEHLRCIKRLITEKDALNKAVQDLNKRLGCIDGSHADELRKAEAAHVQALSELKGRMASQEKAKRDEWTVKEAKRIKESTLKALEPDVALLMNRHKAEKRRMEEEHLEALRRKDDQLLLKEREIAETKLRLGKEMEELIMRERLALRGQVGDESKRVERHFDEERAAIKAQHLVEVRELNERIARLQNEVAVQQQTVASLNAAGDMRAKETRQAHDEAIAAMRREHREELARAASVRERCDADFEAAVAARIDSALAERTAALNRRLTAEKDQAVDSVIARLENEQLRSLKEHRQKESELNEKLAIACRERDRLRGDLEAAHSSLANAKGELRHQDGVVKALRVEADELKHRLADQRGANENEITERLRALDGAWRAKTAALENDYVAVTEDHRIEVLKLNKAAELLREETKANMEVAERRHAAELQTVNDRVQATILKKDCQIRQMQESIQSLETQLHFREIELERHSALLDGN
jgi:hypothetical protein